MHYLAPFRFKKPLFLAISLVGLFWVFGAILATFVLAFATILIGVCYLPVTWSARAAIIAAIAAACACAPGTGKRSRSRKASGRSSRRFLCFG